MTGPEIAGEVQLVWLKRDLRLHDHAPLYHALKSGKRVLLMFIWEDLYEIDPHYSKRHQDFIRQSLDELDQELQPLNSRIARFRGEALQVFERLSRRISAGAVHSHRETGLHSTYQRDLRLATRFRSAGLPWHEYTQNGVLRGLRNRDGWKEHWLTYMSSPVYPWEPGKSQLLTMDEIDALELGCNGHSVSSPQPEVNAFQSGGRTKALETIDSFLEKRYNSYNRNISKPAESRESCSRLSPYIAWGNLSVREVYQAGRRKQEEIQNKRLLSGFLSRLRWQAHFIQKFEMEPRMEFESVNRGYQQLNKEENQDWLAAWEEGLTGFPLVDASMRCLRTTGYLNFRMRALLVSFSTHLLWQPWQSISKHLARQFLDFEPGIHYPQIQMQAGETGINQVRIYNPLKNAHRLDPEARFIKEWIPELRKLPDTFALQPKLLTPMEEQLYGFRLDRDYPMPVVDGVKQWKHASDVLYRIRRHPRVLEEGRRVLKRHTLEDRNPWDE